MREKKEFRWGIYFSNGDVMMIASERKGWRKECEWLLIHPERESRESIAKWECGGFISLWRNQPMVHITAWLPDCLLLPSSSRAASSVNPLSPFLVTSTTPDNIFSFFVKIERKWNEMRRFFDVQIIELANECTLAGNYVCIKNANISWWMNITKSRNFTRTYYQSEICMSSKYNKFSRSSQESY